MFILNDNLWTPKIIAQAQKWGHVIYAITGSKPTRRSKVLWSCSNHPEYGYYCFTNNDKKLMEFANDKENGLTQDDIIALIMANPGQAFYASRVDDYLKTKTTCCRPKLYNNRKEEGYQIFKDLLARRGDHYNTTYTLLTSAKDYDGKLSKVKIKCESHGNTFEYSMQDLNFNTSCPCPLCRKDPKHKNVAVDIIKRHNAGRPGQVIRHANRVKEKYNFTCALSNSKFNLQHHHLDGQSFYTQTQLLWEHNGICLCRTIHFDYHNIFLKHNSIIVNEYSKYTFNESDSKPDNFIDETNANQTIYFDNPDLYSTGAEVSRYTFLEYLRFLKYDIKVNNSKYINCLNQKMASEHAKVDSSSSSFGELGKLTLETLEEATKKYYAEYVGKNWALYLRKDIFNANNTELWKKVENTWVF